MPFDERPGEDAARLLGEFAPEVADLAVRLRARVRVSLPHLEERVYRGWGGLGYHARGAGYVFAIFPRDQHVDVGFEHGADLEDPDGLFYRGGKQLRYARLDAWDEARVEALLHMMQAAIAWQSLRSPR